MVIFVTLTRNPTRNKQKQKFIFDQNFVSIKLILVLLFTGGRRKKMSQFMALTLKKLRHLLSHTARK